MIQPGDGQNLLEDSENDCSRNLKKQEKAALSKSVALASDLDGLNANQQNEENDVTNEDELKLPLDNMSSINSIGGDNLKNGDQASKQSKAGANQTKTSYYVRDQFQPIKSHQTNIEKLMVQFKDQQQ